MIIERKIIPLNGHELLLRVPQESDAEMLLAYLKTTCGETRFLAKDPEEITMTLEEERQYIRTQRESDSHLMLLGFLDGVHVGNGSFMGIGPGRYHHRASMGIALYQNYTGMGIGSIMIDVLCRTAAEMGFEQMELEVAADNRNAIALYRKLGFEQYGIFPHAMKYKDGTYADEYWMMKRLNAPGGDT